jgi:hypothetical protein
LNRRNEVRLVGVRGWQVIFDGMQRMRRRPVGAIVLVDATHGSADKNGERITIKIPHQNRPEGIVKLENIFLTLELLRQKERKKTKGLGVLRVRSF